MAVLGFKPYLQFMLHFIVSIYLYMSHVAWPHFLVHSQSTTLFSQFVDHTCCNTNNAPSLNWHLCMTSLCSSLSLLTNMSENKNSLVVIFQSHKAGKCDNVDQLHVDRKLVDNFIRVFEPLHLSPIIFDLYSVSHINVVACLVSMPPISLSRRNMHIHSLDFI